MIDDRQKETLVRAFERILASAIDRANEKLRGDRSYLTANEVATAFGVHRQTVYDWMRGGKLNGERHGGTWRFDRTSVDEFRRLREGGER